MNFLRLFSYLVILLITASNIAIASNTLVVRCGSLINQLAPDKVRALEMMGFSEYARFDVKGKTNILYRKNFAFDIGEEAKANFFNDALKALQNTLREETMFRSGNVTLDFPYEANRTQLNLNGNAWHVEYLKLNELPANTTGKTVNVAVIDTGVDYEHPYLKPYIWKNLEERLDGLDDDGNGFVDDIIGWNFYANNNQPLDDNRHGTHCAGIISCSPQSSAHYSAMGIAKSYVKIIPIKFLGGQGGGSIADGIASLSYAINNGAQVISNSWGGSLSTSSEEYQLMKEVLEEAIEKNILIVNAAGNESRSVHHRGKSVNSPVSVVDSPYMIGVASSANPDGVPSSFTNYGSDFVDIAAPGSNIISTVPGGGFESLSGTSMETPLVSGLSAIMLVKGYSPAEVKKVMIELSTHKDIWVEGKKNGIQLSKGGVINPKDIVGY